MSRKRRKAPLSRHHLRARSRLPNGMDKNWKNVVTIPADFHRAWHFLFGTLDPEEAKLFIDAVMRSGTVWTHYDLNEMRELIMRGYGSEAA